MSDYDSHGEPWGSGGPILWLALAAVGLCLVAVAVLIVVLP